MTTTADREAQSDNKTSPVFWTVYVLRKEDGGLYVGQTNDLMVRLIEHGAGVGAQATAGVSTRLVWFGAYDSRKAAQSVESRIQRALESSPLSVEAMIERFQGLLAAVMPPKTIEELEADRSNRHSAFRDHVHWWTLEITGSHQDEQAHCRIATLGHRRFEEEWAQRRPGPNCEFESAELLQRDREYQALVTVNATDPGRPCCEHCLRLAQGEGGE